MLDSEHSGLWAHVWLIFSGYGCVCTTFICCVVVLVMMCLDIWHLLYAVTRFCRSTWILPTCISWRVCIVNTTCNSHVAAKLQLSSNNLRVACRRVFKYDSLHCWNSAYLRQCIYIKMCICTEFSVLYQVRDYFYFSKIMFCINVCLILHFTCIGSKCKSSYLCIVDWFLDWTRKNVPVSLYVISWKTVIETVCQHNWSRFYISILWLDESLMN